ncbi:hypothetical protein AAG906_005018 [Vitis piasezkii]
MRVLSSDTSDVGDETQPSRFSANQSSLLSLNFPHRIRTSAQAPDGISNQTRVIGPIHHDLARSNPHGSLRGVEPWPRVTPVRPGGRLDIWIMECSRESQGKQNSLV